MFFFSFFRFFLILFVIRPAKYKLPIIREICICMFSLYMSKFKKRLLFYCYYSSVAYASFLTLDLSIFILIDFEYVEMK